MLLSAAMMVLLCSGCDTRSDPDVPPQPYHVAAIYSFPAEAKDVSAQGDLAAVAASSYGMLVLDVRDLAHIDNVYRDTVSQSPGQLWGVSKVAIDTINHVVGFSTEPRDQSAPNRMVNYLSRVTEYFSVPGGQGPYYGFAFEARRNEITFWGSMHSMFHGNRICRETDSSTWGPDRCELSFSSYLFPRVSGGSTQNRGQGFAHRVRDHLMAVAVEGAGVHFLNDTTGALLSIRLVPGSAYDCKWYEDSLLVVAADFEMVVMNVRDAANPIIISEYTISNSDRMRGVAIDGNWACIMDGYDGIYVVDISNPRRPVYVQLLKLVHPTSIYVDNGRLYATDESSGLVIYTR